MRLSEESSALLNEDDIMRLRSLFDEHDDGIAPVVELPHLSTDGFHAQTSSSSSTPLKPSPLAFPPRNSFQLGGLESESDDSDDSGDEREDKEEKEKEKEKTKEKGKEREKEKTEERSKVICFGHSGRCSLTHSLTWRNFHLPCWLPCCRPFLAIR